MVCVIPMNAVNQVQGAAQLPPAFEAYAALAQSDKLGALLDAVADERRRVLKEEAEEKYQDYLKNPEKHKEPPRVRKEELKNFDSSKKDRK